MENMGIYNAVKAVPDEAKKQITGGRLKGFTDINPMWRIKTLTERFGAVGFGWYYDIINKRIEDGANGEKAVFVDIALYVKLEDEWSKPIYGTGGSLFVTKEKNGHYVNDECFKMALTDAISVACKALGIGADVYWVNDVTKRNQETKPDAHLEVQRAIESELLIKVNECNTVAELEMFYKSNRQAFANQNDLIQACGTRKKELSNEAA